jgi:cytochrome c oxidase subunit II
MMPDFPLIPPQASDFALQYDVLLFFLTALSFVISVGIFMTIIFLGIRYRKKEGGAFEPSKKFESLTLELTWTIIPLVIGMGIFVWGAVLFYGAQNVPTEGTLDIHVVGKQWMWKIQHPNGTTLTNELRIPTGRPIQIILTSQDVIHSFFLPAFRVKQDAVPGKYTKMWVEANKTGTFPLYCAEYCGTEHSRMIGKVVVMDPVDYERWLAGASTLSPVAAGEQLFTRLGCVMCHAEGPTQRGPSLHGVYMSEVRLRDGSTVVADDEYLRESIVDPAAKIVDGYTPLMPNTYGSQTTEEELMQIVAYIKQLGDDGQTRQ